MNWWLKLSKGHAKSFSAFLASKNWLGRCRGCDVSSKWMTLTNHYMLSRCIIMRLSWSRKAMRTHFLHPGLPKKRLKQSRGSDDSSTRMALRNNNLLSGRLKMRLWVIRWSDDWRCRQAMRTYFLHPGHPKKRLLRSRGIEVSRMRMTMITHNRYSWFLKIRFS
jgi:hypothetical protein